MILKQIAAAVLASIFVITSPMTTSAYESSSCLNELYQTTHTDTLTCQSRSQFWTKVTLTAQPTCITGRFLRIRELAFDAKFTESARDFSIFVYSGSQHQGEDLPLYGEKCTIQTLGESHDDTSDSMAMIMDEDGDTCHDVIVDDEANGLIEKEIAFDEEFNVPCTDFGTGKGTVQLQICTSWGGSETSNYDCDRSGPHPCGPESCWCDMIDIGVQILSEDLATPTCAPSTVRFG